MNEFQQLIPSKKDIPQFFIGFSLVIASLAIPEILYNIIVGGLL